MRISHLLAGRDFSTEGPSDDFSVLRPVPASTKTGDPQSETPNGEMGVDD